MEADGAGFPDLLALRAQQLIVAELKSARGKVTPEQAVWLAAFDAAGVPSFVWTPGDWDEIEQVLGRRAV